jgi:hypothetical protein
MSAPTPSVVGAVEGVVGGAGPSSPQPAATAVKVPMPRHPAEAPQDHDASERAIRAASPEIQEAGENSGATLSQDVRGSDA